MKNLNKKLYINRRRLVNRRQSKFMDTIRNDTYNFLKAKYDEQFYYSLQYVNDFLMGNIRISVILINIQKTLEKQLA